jgi:hypothetical protein
MGISSSNFRVESKRNLIPSTVQASNINHPAVFHLCSHATLARVTFSNHSLDFVLRKSTSLWSQLAPLASQRINLVNN